MLGIVFWCVDNGAVVPPARPAAEMGRWSSYGGLIGVDMSQGVHRRQRVSHSEGEKQKEEMQGEHS